MAPPGIASSVEDRRVNDTSPGTSQKDIIVLDGGFATQLSCHVQQPIDGDVLWSARFLATDKEAVIDTHLDFLRAGADLIMTNTYQASVDLFMKHLNMTAEQSYGLIKQAVDLARTAVKRYEEEFPGTRGEFLALNRPSAIEELAARTMQPPFQRVTGLAAYNFDKVLDSALWVPYGASLHDGSEYTGSYAKNTSVNTMRDWHIPRIKALVEGGVDLLALETIPCKVEAEMLVNLLKEQFPDTKAWLSFSVRVRRRKIYCFRENFQEVAKYCYDLNPNQITAVGINCTAPRLIESFISGINKDRKNKPLPLIVYPNSGENYNVELGWINRDKCEPVETYIHKWLDLGVTWVGGCCRTYAIDVTRIRREVELWKQKEKH
ncbi:hypothetical protein NQ318_007465 [Aromia moschata]|uniref:Hcy-binding domain-containing protein n=1 Tax=Aromia moschata TaxID=1265417 RepID=A0AAV8YMZ4_9CUCU|nr:hypothetical protein NQ318_007465 [Aromia moschata]